MHIEAAGKASKPALWSQSGLALRDEGVPSPFLSNR